MITSDDIAKAFNNAGIDTPEKANATVLQLSLQSQLKQLDIQLDGLNVKQTEALAPIVNARIDLQNKRADLVAQLSS